MGKIWQSLLFMFQHQHHLVQHTQFMMQCAVRNMNWCRFAKHRMTKSISISYVLCFQFSLFFLATLFCRLFWYTHILKNFVPRFQPKAWWWFFRSVCVCLLCTQSMSVLVFHLFICCIYFVRHIQRASEHNKRMRQILSSANNFSRAVRQYFLVFVQTHPLLN